LTRNVDIFDGSIQNQTDFIASSSRRGVAKDNDVDSERCAVFEIKYLVFQSPTTTRLLLNRGITDSVCEVVETEATNFRIFQTQCFITLVELCLDYGLD